MSPLATRPPQRLRFGFANRLFLGLAALVLAVVGVLAWMVDRELARDLVSVDMERQLGGAQHLADALDTPAVAARGDVLALAHGLPIEEFLVSTERDAPGLRASIERAFAERLKTQPDYLQLRVLDGHGREQIRVERTAESGAVRILAVAELQNKATRDYFKRGMRVPDGEAYASPIQLNREHGKVEVPHKPVVRTAAPVYSQKRPLGLVVLNVGLLATLRQVKQAAPAEDKAYVVNAAGYFILHPDPFREFAEDLGGAANWQTEFPQLSELHVDEPRVITSSELGEVAVVPLRFASNERLTVFTIRPSLDSSLTRAVRNSVLRVVGIGLFAAILVAFLFARAVARPVVEVTEAVAAFPQEPSVSLPTARGDEVGTLARTFERMRDEVIAREAALKLEEERFRRVFEAAPGALLLIEAGDQVQLANTLATELTGRSLEQLIATDVTQLFPERLQRTVREELARFREQKRAEPLDLEVAQGAREVAVEMKLGSVVAEPSDAVLMILVDVSRRNQIEANLKRSNAELEQFAYVASHDLQEPLRMVASYTELLARRYSGKLDEKADQYIEYASQGARRMQTLIVDLLEFSRVEREGKPFEVVDAQRVVEDALRALRVSIAESKAEIDVGELPQVQGDEGQLRQVFQNLIGNALKFAREGESPRVRVRAKRAPPGWEFEVSDEGIGIPPEQAERVFQMFQRLHSRQSYPGSGIGLSITKRIIERHQGEIWLDPGKRQGCTFRFTLPAAEREHRG